MSGEINQLGVTLEIGGRVIEVLSVIVPDDMYCNGELIFGVPLHEATPGSLVFEPDQFVVRFASGEEMRGDGMITLCEINIEEQAWWARVLFWLGMQRFAPPEPTSQMTLTLTGSVEFLEASKDRGRGSPIPGRC
jgi:hypothetical protein